MNDLYFISKTGSLAGEKCLDDPAFFIMVYFNFVGGNPLDTVEAELLPHKPGPVKSISTAHYCGLYDSWMIGPGWFCYARNCETLVDL